MDSSLPEELRERTRWVRSSEQANHRPGEFVLYWMHNALRAHENPALDVAISLARQNGLPLLVYHGLSEDYPFASDRIHTFLLQGHRDVQRELSERGISAVFHPQRQGDRGPYLRNLARDAAVLVTEEIPVQPLVGWLERLTQTTDTPVAAVDTTCLAPVMALNRDYTSASSFRRDAARWHQGLLENSYQEQAIDCAMCDPEWIEQRYSLRSVDLSRIDLAELLKHCKIDHSVAPVAETPGGTRAGYARWQHFLQSGVQRYRYSRNNPVSPDGSSRMSAYLHYGMVSPFRIARDAAKAGAQKYLDELLVWREMAFHFCFHHTEVLDSLEAIPTWARETLIKHANDARLKNCSWERLSRGHSDQPLWDAAQRSLLKHGELHNNVRMTWGKSTIPWLSSPLRALQLTLDLNHRYALDGRNPSSYGGILWCFGQFDRPDSNEKPVYGKLPSRDLETQASRIDLKRFLKHIDRPIAGRLPTVAIIGGGISGLIAARTLCDHGLDVTVFEKARGVGGRTSTRRTDLQDGTQVFVDHGAQYFTARDPRFCRYVQSWLHDGVVQPWTGRVVQLDSKGAVVSEKVSAPRYVGSPGMNAIAKHLASNLRVNAGTRVTKLAQTGEQRWALHADDTSLGDFDVVLISAPAPQTADLLAGHTRLESIIRDVQMEPCWTLMMADERIDDLPFGGAVVHQSPIGWIGVNSSKPGRDPLPSVVVQATPMWTRQHLDTSSDAVQAELAVVLADLTGLRIESPRYQTAHRWMYSHAKCSLNEEALFDPAVGLGAFGDWCCGTKVEAAFLSGMAMAGSVLRHYTIDRAPFQDKPSVTQPSLFD
ncbi:MAG: FAD-dependent oxidoreductase [Planctomycetota bacterium]